MWPCCWPRHGRSPSPCGCRWRRWSYSTAPSRARSCPPRRGWRRRAGTALPHRQSVAVPETVAPDVGDVMLTVGAVVSETVTLTEADVEVLLAASRATALSVCVPMEAVAVFHDTE